MNLNCLVMERFLPLGAGFLSLRTIEVMTTQTEFKFWNFNMWQNISATGLIVSAMSQAGLFFADKQMENFTYLYYIWAAIFAAGTILKYYYFKNGIEPGHHHHD